MSWQAGAYRADRPLYWILLALPVINAIADSTIYYFVEADSAEGIHPGIIRGGILIAFFLLFGFKRIQRNDANIIIIIFLLYLFVLTLLSSNVSFSFMSGYIKWFIPLMMFPVGIWFFRDFRRLLTLNKVYVWGAAVVCVNLAVAQFTGYGISAYVEESFYTGGAGVGITNQLTLVLLTYPVILRQRARFSNPTRWFIYIVGLLSIAFVLIAMKRSGIVSLLAGGLIYLYFTQSKIRFVRYAVVVVLSFVLVFPIFESILKQRYDARMKQMENIENEARYQEFFFVIKEFSEASVDRKLFGSEVFNTGQFFGEKYFNTNRMIHSDMSAFFYGAGLVGLLLYFGVFFFIMREGVQYRIVLRPYPFARDIFAVYYAILAATFLISVSGSGTIGERCLVFLYLGGIIGVAQTMAHNRRINAEKNNGSFPADIR
jgi:hypothetical protein